MNFLSNSQFFILLFLILAALVAIVVLVYIKQPEVVPRSRTYFAVAAKTYLFYYYFRLRKRSVT